MLYILQGFSKQFWVEFSNDINVSFGLPAQYEYKLVVTCVGVDVFDFY